MNEHNTSGVKRAVVFDFGGVLVRTVDYTPRHAWDDRLGLPRGSVERVVHGSHAWREAQLGRLTPEQHWAQVAAELGLDAPLLAQFRRDYFSGDQLDADLVALIQALRASGHTVGLLSNDTLDLHQRLRALGIAALFDPLLISARLGAMKPDPAAYRALLAALGRPPDEVIFVDDLPANAAGAQALGIHAVRYTAGMDLCAALALLLIGKTH
ncbi:MAG: HAD family hydrolase [Aggregatilineales bacterium]